MRKPVLVITICFVLLQSCSTPTPPPTSAPTSTYTATVTPPDTATPTATASPTIVKIPTVDYNATATPPAFVYVAPTPIPGMPTFTPIPTPTPSIAGPGFEWVKTAGTQFYWGVCTPNKIKLTAQVSEPKEVLSVTLFVRMRRLKAQIFTPWNKGIGMEHLGEGLWAADIYANSIDGHEAYRKGLIWYQVVAVGANNIEVGRTHVYQDALKLEPCMCLTPPCEPDPKKP